MTYADILLYTCLTWLSITLVPTLALILIDTIRR